MLQKSASLIVDDCDSSELEEEHEEGESQAVATENNSSASHEFANYAHTVRPTSGPDHFKQQQPLPVTHSSVATSAESNSFWRGLVEDEFVPTAAARPTAAAIRAAPLTSTAASLTSTDAAITTTATTIPTAAALTSTAAAATSTATAIAPTAAAATSIAALRATVAAKAVAITSTAASRKDRRPKIGKRRRKQPAIREPLAALEKEQKLYELRDRQRQEFVAEVTSAYRDKSYRRPYAQAKKEQGTTEASDVVRRGNSTVGRKSADLKNILKNSGGLSLSEILQQKNLSLDDLLKGKQTALLALQTTAATAPQQKQETNNVRLTKTKRRKPTTQPKANTTIAATSKESNDSSEEQDSDKPQQKQTKQKLKLPALQRLKLFGTSSRVSANNGELLTTSRRKEQTQTNTTRAISTAATTTTTTSTTTKRVPIYRKRQQLLQRTTLKPLGLLKSTATAATTTTAASTTTTATVKDSPAVAKTLPAIISSRESSDEQFDDEVNSDKATEFLTTAAATTTTRSAAKTTTTTIKPKTTTISVKITTTAATNVASSSVISKIQTRYDKNPKTNIIELDEQPRKHVGSAENAVTYAADDDLEDFFEESTIKGITASNTSTPSYTNISNISERITPRLDRQSARPTNDYDNLSYVDPVDDRTDLLELIEDRRSGNRLFKVLEQRNMTLEELIEHRKRGSSQLHLAMVVQNQSRLFPDKKVILRDNMDIVTAFENFPHFNLMNLKSVKPDEIKTDSQGSSYFTSIIDIEPTDEIYKDDSKGESVESGSGVGAVGGGLKGPTYAQTQRSEKSLGVFPPWNTLALASLAHTAHARTNHVNQQQQQFLFPQTKLLLENTADISSSSLQEELSNESEILLNNNAQLSVAPVDTVEAIENEVARAHDLLDLELSGHGFKRSPAAVAASMTKQQQSVNNNIYGSMPAGIRSAIVASAAIVLTSLATFMVIFVVCRWKQHKRRKTNYMKTYNAMKSKLPMIATTTTSRQSSLHSHHIEDSSMVQSSAQHQMLEKQQQPQQQQMHHQPGKRLFRSSSSHSLGGMGISSTSTLFSAGRTGGLGTGSTTSLALSLTSTHNVSSTKLNTMDPNSPEVQEYLYDALRKSF